MSHVALFVRLTAKPGKEETVAAFLAGAISLVEAEPATLSWYALRFDRVTFGIFDTFADDGGRQAHLAGQVAEALMSHAPDLLAGPPVIEQVDILVSK
jgi:quinol monooxygenase YgiN